MNGYTYGAGDPVNNTDPTGKMLMVDGGGFIGSIQALEYHYSHLNSIAHAVQAYQPPAWQPQYTPVYTPCYTPPPPPRRPWRFRHIQQVHSRQSGGGCGFLGFSCVSHWVTHTAVPFVQHHWRGLSQVATFAACLTPGVLLCLGAMGLDTLATSAADGIQQHSWGVFGKEALIGGAVDVASAGLGFGAGKLLDEGIGKFGLEAAEGSSARGVIGRIFGAYGPEYVAQHAAGVGRHAAPMFHLDPIPTLVQVGSRAGLNELCSYISQGYCP